jgi:hypothetical protein
MFFPLPIIACAPTPMLLVRDPWGRFNPFHSSTKYTNPTFILMLLTMTDISSTKACRLP